MNKLNLVGACFIAGALVLLCLLYASSAGCIPGRNPRQWEMVAVKR